MTLTQPLQLSFYKGLGGKMGAIQFNLRLPHWYCEKYPKLKNFDGKFIPSQWLMDHPDITRDDLTSREGCLFVEITSTVPGKKNEYDWEKKIVIALSITDMSKVLLVLEGRKTEMTIIHDPGAGTISSGKVVKTMHISSPKGISEGVIFTVSKKESDDLIKHMVGLSADETLVLAVAIRQVIPTALAW